MIELEEETADTTEPTVDIQPQAIKAIAYTQSINGKGEWDGTLEFKDEFNTISINNLNVVSFNDAVSTWFDNPYRSAFNETFGSINIKQIDFDAGVEPYTWDKLKSLTWNETKTHTWKILKEGD